MQLTNFKIISLISLAFAIVASTSVCSANPTGGTITSGLASISSNNNTLSISQTTSKLAIDWQTFSIGSGETVNFLQPGATSIAVNRVLGSDPSSIYGSLNANGQVFLINPNGVLFAKGSSVNVGGLVASTLSLSPSDYLDGDYVFKGSGGLVLNQGSITAADGGYVALLGSQASNGGIIVANRGTVALAGGNEVTLDFAGDGLLNVAVNQSALAASALNSGVIAAKGGQVYLTAQAADALAGTVVNNSGVIEAQSISDHNGVITLDGGTNGTVVNSGTLDASGAAAGETGGTVKILGQNVDLTSGADINVSGASGGGTALVGGASHGGSSEYSATDTDVAAGTTIDASAVASGNGGSVVVWSNDTTNYAGDILANGGLDGGNGGSVEVSGKETLDYLGLVNTLAPDGITGSLLLDPSDYTIDAINVIPLENTLATTNATIYDTTSGEGSAPGSGNINVDAQVTWSSSNALTLDATNNININQQIIAASGGLTLSAGGTITAPAEIDVAAFTLNSGSFSQVDPSTPTFYAADFTINGGTFLRANQGDGSSGNPYGIYDIYGLQGINGFLGDDFVQTNYIFGYGTRYWNGGEGFIPLGTSSAPFTGTYNGAGLSIYNLSVNSSLTDVGLFGNIGSAGTVEGVSLVADNISSASGAGSAGALAGINQGTITGSSSDGTVTSATGDSHSIGGLVGSNTGSITGSSVTGSVTSDGAGGSIEIGGLAAINTGSITGSSSSAMVQDSSATGSLGVGGLVGSNGGTISDSYSNGPVTDSSYGNDIYIGGLVGINSATISNSYTTSSVSDVTANGGDTIGGFAGDSEILGSITDSYSSGAVSGRVTDDLGGFLGGSAGSLSDVYWDTATASTAQAVGSGTSSSLTGLADGFTGGAFNESSYTDFDFTNTWFMIDGETRPILQSEYSKDITDAHQLELIALNPSASYTVGNNIELTGDTNQSDIWRTSSDPDARGNYGFVPIGNGGTPFSGSLDGDGDIIDALTGTSGLFGDISTNGSIYNLNLTNVNITNVSGEVSVGALADTSSGTISYSTASGTISDAFVGQGQNDVGGLVGFLYGGFVYNNSNADVTVTTGASSEDHAGGLVGENYSGSISNSYASGNVTDSAGGAEIGGLVGENAGSVNNSYATGTVTDSSTAGGDYVGGFAGINTSGAEISNSYSLGNVYGNSMDGVDYIGGLAGYNTGSSNIEDSYAYGTVADGTTSAGGTSYGGFSDIGGLVGFNESGSTIDNSYASVAVTDQSSVGGDNVGGLVGYNDGGITNTYSIGNVTDINTSALSPIDNVGGLVGLNTANGQITTSYASGVTVGIVPPDNVGGLVGNNSGSITGGYYDTTSTSQANGVGVENSLNPVSVITLSEGGREVSGTDPFYSNSYTNQSNSSENFDFGSNWYMVEGLTRPFLQMEQTTNIVNAHQLQLMLMDPSNAYSQNSSITMPALVESGMWQTATNLDGSSSFGFVPVGNDAAPFTGDFYGGGQTITDLVTSSNGNGVGLFGVSDGFIDNVNLLSETVDAVGGNSGVGGLVGVNQAGGTIDFSQIDATVSDNSEGDPNYLGGAVGENLGSIYHVSAPAGSVTDNATGNGHQDDLGGLVGYNAATGSITYYSNADIAVTDNSVGQGESDNVGGLVGANSGQISGDDIYASGAVSDTSENGSETDNLGGLIGYNTSSITSMSANGDVTDNNKGGSDHDNIGGFIGSNTGSVSDSTSNSATVADQSTGGSEDDNIGGLIGYNNGSISNAATSNIVSDSSAGGGEKDNLGGIVGINDTSGTISGNSFSAGGTYDLGFGGETDNVGGIAGINNGAITGDSSSTSVFDENTSLGRETDNLGGLVGYNTGTLSTDFALGLVTDSSSGGGEADSIGGLVGVNTSTGSIGNSYGEANGYTYNNVSDASTGGFETDSIGGLAGSNFGSITDSYFTSSDSTGSVSDHSSGGSETDNVGGLIGYNDGTITGSYGAIPQVNDGDDGGSGSDNLGGLVGLNGNAGSISGDNYATSSVSDVSGGGDETDNLGGLVGSNLAGGIVTQSYATGNVKDGSTGGDESDSFGGLIGSNMGSVSIDYASGNVTDTNSLGLGFDSLGGLVGVNQDGSITNAYATGNVEDLSLPTETDTIGGLLGTNVSENDNLGLITNTYSVSNVLGGANDIVGGLVGINGYGPSNAPVANITNSYWDTDDAITGIGVENGTGDTVTGLSNAEMQQSSSYDPTWDFVNTWKAYNGETYPLLQYFLTPLTVNVSAPTVTYSGVGNTATYTLPISTNLSEIFGSLNYTDNNTTTSTAVNAGTYTVGGLYSFQQGYNISYTNNTLAVDPKTVTYTVANASSTYGTLATLGAITLNGVIPADTAIVGGVGDVTTRLGSPVTLAVNTAAGTYTEGVTGLIGLGAGNYTLATSGNTNGILTIDPKAITFSYNGSSTGNYGTLPVLGSVDFTGLLPGDLGDVNAVGDITNQSNQIVPIAINTPAGTYNEGVASLTGSAAGNYTVAPSGNTEGLLTINPVNLTITANNATRYQGAPNPTFTFTATGLVGGDTDASLGTVDYTTTATFTSKVGPYPITPFGNTDGNYIVSYLNGVLTVETAPVGPWYYGAVATADQIQLGAVAGPDYWPLVNQEYGVDQTKLGTLSSPDYWPLTIVGDGVNLGR